MPDQYEPFTPQFVDEQIEQFMLQPERQRQASTPETELVKDMHDLYREYAGTRDRVRRRLQEHMASRSRAEQADMGTVRSLPLERQPPKRNKNMYSTETSPLKKRTFKPRLALVAATIFAALLIVALVVPFTRFHSTQPNNPAGTNKQTPPPAVSQKVTGTQTPPPAGNQSGGVYITDSSGILKLDPNTGKTLQTYPWPNKGIYHTGGTIEPYTLQMSGKLLFVGFKLMNSDGHLIYGGVQAFDTSTGEMLWDFEGTTNHDSALTIANGTVYISVDHPDILNRSLVFALRATDGKQLADYDLPLPIEQLTVAGGFLYPMGYENFYGVNLATRATWHITGSQGANQGFSDLHVVNGVLYVSLYNNSTGSFILALNPATGHELWRTQAIPGKIFNFTIVQHVAYFGTDQPLPNVSGDYVGRFDAYDLSQHKLLWETSAPSVARTYAVANGTIYAVTRFSYPGGIVDPKLIAFSANSGKILWSVTAGSQNYSYTPVVTNGHIYIANGASAAQYPGKQMEMVDQANGKTLWEKSFPSQIGGYVVVY
jgi:outer membrane protein assembly factor BamB